MNIHKKYRGVVTIHQSSILSNSVRVYSVNQIRHNLLTQRSVVPSRHHNSTLQVTRRSCSYGGATIPYLSNIWNLYLYSGIFPRYPHNLQTRGPIWFCFLFYQCGVSPTLFIPFIRDYRTFHVVFLSAIAPETLNRGLHLPTTE